MKLAHLVVLAILIIQPIRANSAEMFGKWINGESKDEIEGGVTGYAGTVALKHNLSKIYEPQLAIFCNNKSESESKIVITGIFAGFREGGEAVFKFDELEPNYSTYILTEDGKMAIFDQGKTTFLRNMILRNKKLSIRLKGTVEGFMDFTFSLNGSSKALGQACPNI